jgi:hypothetical protein
VIFFLNFYRKWATWIDGEIRVKFRLKVARVPMAGVRIINHSFEKKLIQEKVEKF